MDKYNEILNILKSQSCSVSLQLKFVFIHNFVALFNLYFIFFMLYKKTNPAFSISLQIQEVKLLKKE